MEVMPESSMHPVETGTLTGYLTSVGDDRFLDVMPARGEDRGSFLLPVHAVLRIALDGDRLELTPLYDWMNDRLRAGTPCRDWTWFSIRSRTRSS